MRPDERQLLRRAAAMIADDARALFASEVDRSGPYKGTVTNRHVWAEILEKRATAKKLLTIARRRGA